MADTANRPPDLSTKLPPLIPRIRKPHSAPERPKSPAPETPQLPSAPSLAQDWKYEEPSRRILSPSDHDLFLDSPSYTLVTSFVFTLSDSVRNKAISSVTLAELSPAILAILSILDEAEELVKKHPPEDNEGSRFGNKSFQAYLDAVVSSEDSWHQKLNLDSMASVPEISTYLNNAFGNRTRIDYGSGHELNFFVWLLCLNRLSILPPSTFPSIVLHVLPRYLRLMRNVQTTYYLEPAGSHGVWGLDDYQFLPFLFGASQLYDHPYIRPKSIHQTLVLEEFSKDYLYLDQVLFVNSVKNVEGLRWHSPMLDDISAAKSWAKIEGGMRKMFVKEVLGKLPVMQHFLFGSLVPATDGMSHEEDVGAAKEEEETEGGEQVVMKDGLRHVHAANSWGDCCGIKVPSTVGAMGEGKKGGLRRIPFD